MSALPIPGRIITGLSRVAFWALLETGYAWLAGPDDPGLDVRTTETTCNIWTLVWRRQSGVYRTGRRGGYSTTTATLMTSFQMMKWHKLSVHYVHQDKQHYICRERSLLALLWSCCLLSVNSVTALYPVTSWTSVVKLTFTIRTIKANVWKVAFFV